MNKEENEVYSKLWFMIVQKLINNNVKYEAWKCYVEIYNEIKSINPEMQHLLLKMATDLLSASVYNFNRNGEYERTCIKLINDKKNYLQELNEKIVFTDNKEKVIVSRI